MMWHTVASGLKVSVVVASAGVTGLGGSGVARAITMSETMVTAASDSLTQRVAARHWVYDRWRTYTTRDGLPSDKAFTVRVVEGRVWVGTDKGAAYLENGVWHQVGPDDGLAHPVVLAIEGDPETGDVWIGTLGGLTRWSAGRLDTFTQFNSGLVNDVVYGVTVEGGLVWAATAAGVSRLDTRTGAWSIFNERNTPMHEPWTYGIHANDGLVYIAAWGGGVLEYDTADGRWREFRDPDGEMEIDLFRDDGVVHDVTTGVAFAEGVLWVGTYFGLSRYDGTHWRGYFDDDSGLASNFINAVRARGRVAWVCTDRGLSAFDGDTWITYRRTPDESGMATITTRGGTVEVRTVSAIADNYVLGVDFLGDTIWVATAAGVSRGLPPGEPAFKEPEGKRP